MKTSETITKIAPALVKAIGSIQGAAKDGKNPHFRSSYATLSSVVDAARLPLLENGIAVVQCQGGITESNTVVMSTRLLHTSGEWLETVCEAKPKSFTPQDIGSSITYLRRYGLMAAVNMPAEDDDGNGSSLGKQQDDVKSVDLEPMLIKISESMDNDSLATVAKEIKSAKLPANAKAKLRQAWAEQKATLIAVEKAEA
jgi:hypothetical protein